MGQFDLMRLAKIRQVRDESYRQRFDLFLLTTVLKLKGVRV